ncbi:unnamed protein product [Ixodes hexagonus]
MSGLDSLLFPVSLEDAETPEFDAVVIVGTGLDEYHLQGLSAKYLDPLYQYKAVDAKAEEETFVLALPELYPVRRLVYSPTGPLNRDQDDIRAFADAACKGVKRAISAGSKKPLVFLPTEHGTFTSFHLVTVLGALHPLYVPLEIRQDVPSRLQKVERLGFAQFPALPNREHIIICRDIGGSDPERMSPPEVAKYVQQVFEGSPVQVQVLSDEKLLEQEYPLLTAVNRAARGIPRHQARMVLLTYTPEGPVTSTVFLVGKGVTYDTGGADVKAGGVMAGMHRDKCGAAAVAGFFKVLSELRPKGVKVYGAMAMVRNSIGPDGYVADEIITSRAGVRVRVGNTDAEGRMAMADVLGQFKEKALHETNPRLFTIATLTGHACLAVGDGYSIILDNGPARKEAVSAKVKAAGDVTGDMFEVSTIRREDYTFVAGHSEYEDVLQSNNLPSSRTPRGHQSPAAFLIRASGLDKHGLDSEKPLCYSHIDIAASSGPFPGLPSGAPIPALVHAFVCGH